MSSIDLFADALTNYIISHDTSSSGAIKNSILSFFRGENRSIIASSSIQVSKPQSLNTPQTYASLTVIEHPGKKDAKSSAIKGPGANSPEMEAHYKLMKASFPTLGMKHMKKDDSRTFSKVHFHDVVNYLRNNGIAVNVESTGVQAETKQLNDYQLFCKEEYAAAREGLRPEYIDPTTGKTYDVGRMAPLLSAAWTNSGKKKESMLHKVDIKMNGASSSASTSSVSSIQPKKKVVAQTKNSNLYLNLTDECNFVIANYMENNKKKYATIGKCDLEDPTQLESIEDITPLSFDEIALANVSNFKYFDDSAAPKLLELFGEEFSRFTQTEVEEIEEDE